MKKLFIISAVALIGIFASCGVLNKASNTLQMVQQISNVSGTANEISNALTSTLGLAGSQTSSVASVLKDYIGGTNSLSSITKASKYARQIGKLNKSTLKSLVPILSTGQYSNLIGLASGGADNIVNNITGGNNLSTGALSVLKGLLGN